MALRSQDRARGLAAFEQSRKARRRAIVLGRVSVREVATRFWILTFVGLLIFGFAYYHYAEAELAAQKNDVLAQQRAVVQAFGERGFTLRDELEGWVQALASGGVDAHLAPEAELGAISRGPGIYLRLPIDKAESAEGIRGAAKSSLHDGFTSCLFVRRRSDGSSGPACKLTSECGPGLLCNDFRVCEEPSQPYNMRLLYDALRVIDAPWRGELEAARNDFQVRAIELDLQDTAKHEIPAAAELVRRSRYFTVVIDELPEQGLPPADPALEESREQQLQAVDHFVRVGVWDIEKCEPLLALRVEAAGRFVPLGRGRAVSTRIVRAQQRQANGCAVATRVREVLVNRSLAADASVALDSAEDLVLQ